VAGDSARRALNDAAAHAGTQLLDNVQVKTSAGVPIPKVVVRYQSSNSLVASFTNPFGTSTSAPQINASSPGVVLLTAEATVYGRRLVDSLWYTVGYPLRVLCSYGSGEFVITGLDGPMTLPANFLSIGQLVIGQGGAVLWGNSIQGSGDDSLDIQFDDTTGIVGIPAPTGFAHYASTIPIAIPAGPGGNIPAFPAAKLTPYFTFRVILYDSTTSKARMFTQPGTYHWMSPRRGISGTVTVVPNDSLYNSFHPAMSR
jgi:hypothetical protein